MRKLALLAMSLVIGACAGTMHSGSTGSRPAGTYDLVITNGRIIDGTGAAWFWGDLAVTGDRIARITPRGRLAKDRKSTRLNSSHT